MKRSFLPQVLLAGLLVSLASCSYLDKFIKPNPQPTPGNQKCLLTNYNNQIYFTYDKCGRLASYYHQKDTSRSVDNYFRYDSQGRLIRIARADSAEVSESVVAYYAIQTNATGNITSLSGLNRYGEPINYAFYSFSGSYNAANRLASYGSQQVRAEKYYFIYDQAGNATRIYTVGGIYSP